MHKADGVLVNTGRRTVDGPAAALPLVHFYGAALICFRPTIAGLFVLLRVGHVEMDFIRRCVRPRAINALVGERPCGPRGGSPDGPLLESGAGVWSFHIFAGNGSGGAALSVSRRKRLCLSARAQCYYYTSQSRLRLG